MNKLVSIIVPCYNLEKYILDCLNSISKLDYCPLEIIIVDDGSTDSSVAIISSFIKNYSREEQKYRLIKQKNGGASSARNLGLHNATGEFIAFIDGDDTVDKDYITKMISNLELYNTDLCLSGVREMDEEGKCKPDFKLHDDLIREKNNILLDIDKQSFVLCNLYCKIYKNKIIKQYGLELDTRLKISEDLSFNLDYCKEIDSVSFIDYCGYNYRVREGSLIHNVTLPTKQKYVLSHFNNYFSVFSNENVKITFEKNRSFLQLFWNYGILNYVLAQILESKNYKTIYNDEIIKIALDMYKPTNKKDKIFANLKK